jgi:hypothetical protein
LTSKIICDNILSPNIGFRSEIMNDEIEVSPIERMAIRARQTGPDGETEGPRLKMVSLRVPLSVLASLDAFASITAQSRNTTAIELLEAGVYAVGNALDDPEQFYAAREHYLDRYLDQQTQGE